MKSYVTLAVIAVLASASSVKSIQFFNGDQNLLSSGPFAHQQAYNQPQNGLEHPAVVRNSIAESQLPHQLKNPFYNNPVLASALAQESWFGDKEFPVHHREAERISREEIYKIISRLRS
ncbi:unnamed protein product [Phyllotreta striolata]|uniref:Uncharacterized protein n=1 Tax=Phyllotreta striolata TaxID=444603 RepID=A0A9N9XRB8_PHYSR|nr:unnamed protein product [Phyllotreta striolata]